jgi:hypothetical protein
LWERFKAFLLIKRSYRPKYGSIAQKLLQQYALDTNQYPKTMEAARRVLESHHPWDEGWNKVKQQCKEQAASQQQSASNNQRLPSTNTNDNSMISQPPGEISLNQMESRYFQCGAKDHHSNSSKCPKHGLPIDQWFICKTKEIMNAQHAIENMSVSGIDKPSQGNVQTPHLLVVQK